MIKHVTLIAFLFLSIQTIQAAEGNQPSKGGGGGGWRESYGGDAAVMEFKHLSRDVAYVLNSKNYDPNFGLDLTKLKTIIDNSVITCETNLSLDGVAKDAINYPREIPQRITLDCEKWNTKLTKTQKYRLALHEYMPLAGFDDSNYNYSEDLFRKYNDVKIAEPVNPVLILNVMDTCSVSQLREASELGLNLFGNYATDRNLLQIAVEHNCKDIVKDLMDLGLEYILSNRDIDPYGHFVLLTDVFLGRLNKQDALELVSMLVKKWPYLVNTDFKNDFWIYPENAMKRSFSLKQECFHGSTIMHLLTSTTRSKDQIDIDLLRQLKNLGFSIDDENSCGQTPRAALNAMGITL